MKIKIDKKSLTQPLVNLVVGILFSASAFGAPRVCATVLFTGKEKVSLETPFSTINSSDFPTNFLAAKFVEMAFAGKLLDQGDPKLVKAGLAFKDEGGVCGPTCYTNIAMAAHANDKSPRSGQEILSNILQSYFNIDDEHDPRMGTNSSYLAKAVQSVPEFKGSALKEMGLEEMTSSKISFVLADPSPRILAASIQFEGASSGHEIVILKIDPDKKTVVIGDPNYPENIYSTSYRESKAADEMPIFEIQLLGKYSGDLKKLTLWTRLAAATLVTWSP